MCECVCVCAHAHVWVCVTSLSPVRCSEHMFQLWLWWALELGPLLCHILFVRRGASTPCSVGVEPHKDEPNLQIICSEAPQPCPGCLDPYKNWSPYIPRSIAYFPKYQAHTFSPWYSLPSLSSHLPSHPQLTTTTCLLAVTLLHRSWPPNLI